MTDLNALADRLDKRTEGLRMGLCISGQLPADDCATAARILRAVAAAPGPLRGSWDWELQPFWNWFDALADAVGEQ